MRACTAKLALQFDPCHNHHSEKIKELRQPGNLGVLRELVYGFSEEARTRGFASLTFVRFAFVESRHKSALPQNLCQLEDVPSAR